MASTSPPPNLLKTLFRKANRLFQTLSCLALSLPRRSLVTAIAPLRSLFGSLLYLFLIIGLITLFLPKLLLYSFPPFLTLLNPSLLTLAQRLKFKLGTDCSLGRTLKRGLIDLSKAAS
ncbi:unnamed protein product (mitochondrion) [Musa textilis]